MVSRNAHSLFVEDFQSDALYWLYLCLYLIYISWLAMDTVRSSWTELKAASRQHHTTNADIFAGIFLCRCERNSLPWLWTCSSIFVFEFRYTFYSIGQGKSSPILCGSPISIKVEITYPYLHGLPQKFKSPRIWAYRILGSLLVLFCIISDYFIIVFVYFDKIFFKILIFTFILLLLSFIWLFDLINIFVFEI